MSYILDALKRADAERGGASSSDPTPGLQALAPSSPQGRRKLPQGVVLLSLGLLLIAALLTWWLRKDPAPAPAFKPSASVAVTPAMPAVPPQSRPESADQAAPPAPAATPQKPAPFVGPRQPTSPILMPPMSGSPSAQPAGPNTGPVQLPMQGRPIRPRENPSSDETAIDDSATGTMAPGAAPAPSAGVPAASVPTQPVQTSPAVPLTLPSAPVFNSRPTEAPGALASDAGLKVTGATYSENPAHRLLIVNGKVVKEGQEVEPGIVLEVISPRSAVFKRQGTRFNVNY